MFAAGGNLGLAEWIINDTCLVLFMFEGIIQGGLENGIFNKLALEGEVKEIALEIVGILLSNLKIEVPNGQEKEILCNISDDSCDLPSKANEIYIKECTLLEEGEELPALCQLTNLVILQDHLYKGAKLRALANTTEIDPIPKVDVEKCKKKAKSQIEVSADGEVKIIPDLQDVVNACKSKLPLAAQRFITTGVIQDISKVMSSRWRNNHDGIPWMTVYLFIEEQNMLRDQLVIPKVQHFGSLVNTFKVLDRTDKSLNEDTFQIERDPANIALVGRIEELEKQILNQLLGVYNVTFKELAHALVPHHPVQEYYDKRTGDYFFQKHSKLNNHDWKLDRKQRSLLKSILSHAVALPLDATEEDESNLVTALGEHFPIIQVNHSLFSNNVPFCLAQGQAIGKMSGFKQVPICDEVTTIMTDRGLCFAFNVMDIDKVLLGNPSSSGIMSKFNSTPFYAEEGSHNGFTLVMEANKHFWSGAYLPGFVQMDMAGNFKTDEFDIMLSHFGTYPVARHGTRRHASVKVQIPRLSDSEDTFYQKYHIAVTALVTQVSEDARSISPEMRGCLFEDEGNLQLFQHYSSENCMLECKLRLAEQACQCIPWNYLAFSNSGLCTPLGNICFDEAMAKIGKSVSMAECGCERSCNDIQYTFELVKVEKVPIVFQSWDPVIPNDLIYVANYTKEYLR